MKPQDPNKHPPQAPDAPQAPNTPATDRRHGHDRRRADVPLAAGRRDRRRGLEARKPEVVEIDMSLSEWAALSDLPAPKK